MHIILLGIACLCVQFFAKYAGLNVKKMLYDLVGLGGLFFLLTAASGLDTEAANPAASAICEQSGRANSISLEQPSSLWEGPHCSSADSQRSAIGNSNGTRSTAPWTI